jgi:type IV pilus assembly protein PilE
MERTPLPARNTGVTLIELLVTVAIIGILSAIAIPSYTEYVRRSNRTDARAQLMQAALFMQRSFSQNNVYPDVLPVSLTRSPAEGDKKYDIAVVTAAGGMSYTLTATRAATMATDECGDYVLTNSGGRSLLNQASGRTADVCWGR